ncbi:MAG: amidophosphoribosyltransferase, partial [Euryarchaeota archaeon RBG_19FT_COMBO_56_21]
MDPEHPQEECGVFAIASIQNVSIDVFYALRVLQHRGQESAGIAVYNNGIKAIKGMGLAHQALKPDDIKNLKGEIGIGHVRYSTFGSSTIENAQPIVVSTNYGDIALGHNGEIVNADKIMEDLKKKGWAFITSTDSEIAVRLLANDIANTGDPVRSLKNLMSILQGSYSMTIMIDNRIFAIRDPLGFRPLCVGRTKGGYAAASESVVFDTLGGEFIRDVDPGEIVELLPGEIRSTKTGLSKGRAHCMFEWVYLARADSSIEGHLVYEVRRRIGQRLAKEQPADVDVVVPIPDSGRSHAIGYSEESGIRYSEGLM